MDPSGVSGPSGRCFWSSLWQDLRWDSSTGSGFHHLNLHQEIIMHIRSPASFILAAFALGATTGAVQAQLLPIDLHVQATFGPFVGGTNNFVTNNGGINSVSTITTGTPIINPFSITYQPLFGQTSVQLNTGTLNTGTFVWDSPTTPLDFFNTLAAELKFDFDGDLNWDLIQNYSISLTAFTSPNNLTGVSYAVVPHQSFGNVTIDGVEYAYASTVSNHGGTLFSGSNTSSAIQFQFMALNTPVPEPSTYAMGGLLALGGILAARRRRVALAAKA